MNRSGQPRDEFNPRNGSGESVDVWLETTTRMAAGDPVAFQAFYDHYFELMVREASRCTGRDEPTCLDIAQDSVLKSMRYMRPISNQNQVHAFVRVLTRSVAYDWLRREKRNNLRLQKLGTITGAPSSLTELDEGRLAWLGEQLEQLDPQLRQILDWRYRWGWTLQAIAQRLGWKTGAVDGQIRRTVEKLRVQAEQENFDE